MKRIFTVIPSRLTYATSSPPPPPPLLSHSRFFVIAPRSESSTRPKREGRGEASSAPMRRREGEREDNCITLLCWQGRSEGAEPSRQPSSESKKGRRKNTLGEKRLISANGGKSRRESKEGASRLMRKRICRRVRS